MRVHVCVHACTWIPVHAGTLARLSQRLFVKITARRVLPFNGVNCVNLMTEYVLAVFAEWSVCVEERERCLLVCNRNSGCRLQIWGQCIQSLDTVWHLFAFFLNLRKLHYRNLGLCASGCVCMIVHAFESP